MKQWGLFLMSFGSLMIMIASLYGNLMGVLLIGVASLIIGMVMVMSRRGHNNGTKKKN